MLYYHQFKSFNPLVEYVPFAPFSYLPKIVWRARALLHGRSIEQIEKMAKEISDDIGGYYEDEKSNAISELKSKFSNGELSAEEFESFFDWDGGSVANGRWLFKHGMEDELDIPTENNDSEVDALKAVIESRDGHMFWLPEDSSNAPHEYSDIKDYEMFAVMSLWFVADALDAINKGGINSKSIAGDYLIESMDAVSYAEYLRDAEWLVSYTKKTNNKTLSEALSKQKAEHQEWFKYQQRMDKERKTHKLSEQGKKGAAIKHKNTNEAKNELKEIWASGKYTSRDVCAEQECARLNLSFSTARKALRNTPEPIPST